jgi:hypothetical protein
LKSWSTKRVLSGIDGSKRAYAATFANDSAQQFVDDDGAANLVAVRQRVDHHVRACHSGIKSVDKRDTGITGGVHSDIRKVHFDRVSVHSYSSPP